MSYQPASTSRIILQQGDEDTSQHTIQTPVATPIRSQRSTAPPPYTSNYQDPSAPNASILSSRSRWDTSSQQEQSPDQQDQPIRPSRLPSRNRTPFRHVTFPPEHNDEDEEEAIEDVHIQPDAAQ